MAGEVPHEDRYCCIDLAGNEQSLSYSNGNTTPPYTGSFLWDELFPPTDDMNKGLGFNPNLPIFQGIRLTIS